LRRRFALCCAAALAALCAGTFAAGADTTGAAATGMTAPPASARVEARSADLMAVGLVRGDRMTIHLSRLVDNAPVRDATVTVVLRGVAHPTTAEADGSYTLQAKDLTLPGAAAMEFQVAQAAARQSLRGTLNVAAAAAASEDKNTARQLWWWVLNFAVCIGFLWLISRRRKAAQSKEPV
jgi:cobalt-zinc-cadmium efflux system membrane fusion protein